MTRRALGGHRDFAWWTGRGHAWGPDDRSRVWFAGGVVDGLAEIIGNHIAEVEDRARGDSRPAAIGCVPYLTCKAIADRLARLGGCCIVIDKGAGDSAPLRRLAAGENRFPNVLWNLRDRAPAESGGGAMLGPHDDLPACELGPVRIAGWGGDDRKPLVHAKVLVLGELSWGEDEFGREDLDFHPRSVWLGSANWTAMSGDHLELGLWTEDRGLANAATGFLGSVIAFSEPWDSQCVGPQPDLVAVEFDDDACREAAERELPP